MKWAIGQSCRPDAPATASILALPAISKKAKTKAHRKALPYAGVVNCITTVNASGAWTATKLALEFLILTAARFGEGAGLDGMKLIWQRASGRCQEAA